jgi:hypothetical protein
VSDKRIFTFAEANGLVAAVRHLTEAAMARAANLLDQDRVLAEWSDEITTLGCVVKGPWLVDFDNGSGFYCWRWPEPRVEYFHGYDEGFNDRVRIH